MAAQILEGTLAEVQQQMSKLHLKLERRVRFVLEDNEAEQEAIRRRKGVRLFPVTDPNFVLTH